jgi:hypothetical protein
MKFIAILLLSSLVGCVPVPVYKTLQPTASIRVINENGDPIPKAEVALIANTYPYRSEKGRSLQSTDESGIATFTKNSKWRIEYPLVIHGQESFFWNWCV